MKNKNSKTLLFLSLLLAFSLNTAQAQGFGGLLNNIRNKLNEASKEIREMSVVKNLEVDNSLLDLNGVIPNDVKSMTVIIKKNNFKEQLTFDVSGGNYQFRVPLQDGSGLYEIGIFTNKSNNKNALYDHFKIFWVENIDSRDMSFLLPTLKAQADDERIKNLVSSITENATNDEEAFIAIYKFVTKTIKYDYDALRDSSLRFDYNAINTLTYSKAVCEGYANLLAAMARAYGIRTKVIFGIANNSLGTNLHAWNEVFLNDEWKLVDATWDSILQNQTYLFMDAKEFAKEHTKETEMSY